MRILLIVLYSFVGCATLTDREKSKALYNQDKSRVKTADGKTIVVEQKKMVGRIPLEEEKDINKANYIKNGWKTRSFVCSEKSDLNYSNATYDMATMTYQFKNNSVEVRNTMLSALRPYISRFGSMAWTVDDERIWMFDTEINLSKFCYTLRQVDKLLSYYKEGK